MQADDSGFRITEDASDGLARSETGEAVRVPQAMVFWHPQSIPDLRIPEYRENPSKHLAKSLFSAIIYPLDTEKTLNCYMLRCDPSPACAAR
jgi:hypothetical protein